MANIQFFNLKQHFVTFSADSELQQQAIIIPFQFIFYDMQPYLRPANFSGGFSIFPLSLSFPLCLDFPLVQSFVHLKLDVLVCVLVVVVEVCVVYVKVYIHLHRVFSVRVNY